MKRRWIVAVVALVVLIAILGVGLTADGDDPLEGQPTATPTATATATPTATATATPTATRTATPRPPSEARKEHGGVQITVWQPTTAQRLVFPNETKEPAEGTVFLLVRIDVENVGDEPINVPSDLEIVHGDSEYEVVDDDSSDPPNSIESPSRELYRGGGVIYPEVERNGWVYAEIPADADRVEFTWHYRGTWADERVLRWQLDVDGNR